MICPKCGFDSSLGQECTRCGVIFSRIKDRQTEPAPGIENAPKTNSWVKILVVCISVGLAIGAFKITLPFFSSKKTADPPIETTSSEEQEKSAPKQGSTDLSVKPFVKEPVPEKGSIEKRERIEPAPPRYLSSIQKFHSWHNGASEYELAIEQQKTTGAPLLLYIGVDWCPYCRQLENQILPEYEVGKTLDYAIKVKIDPEKGDKERNIANKMGATGYPSLFLIAEPGARQIQVQSGTAKGMKPKPQNLVDDFREKLKYSWRKSAIDAINNKQLERAIELADRILAFNPDDPKGDMYHIRALAFFYKKDLPQAIRDFQLACQAGFQEDCDELKRRGI